MTMQSFRVLSDLDQCEAIWKQNMPAESIADVWEVRECFHRHFRNPPHFIVFEDNDGLSCLLPLSWIEECGCYGFFPGETWQGKTWLEQNKIICRGDVRFEELISSACPSSYYLRYLSWGPGLPAEHTIVDEIGYLFFPPRYNYEISNYFEEFPRKSRKTLAHALVAVEDLGVEFRFDEPGDIDIIFDLNLQRFGSYSYFHDSRFRESFRSLSLFLEKKGWLRITTLWINGEPAASDLGCIYRGTYTLLAGGTNPRYPGIAKLINIHHMRRACQERLDEVDFLCGDFNWKKLFHLTPRPLFLLSNIQAKAA